MRRRVTAPAEGSVLLVGSGDDDRLAAHGPEPATPPFQRGRGSGLGQRAHRPQAVMRHANIQTTSRYLTVRIEEIFDALLDHYNRPGPKPVTRPATTLQTSRRYSVPKDVNCIECENSPLCERSHRIRHDAAVCHQADRRRPR
ncbi:hypothetical protein [Embleya sp. NBC_00896]|uniref:hypothetical protein n=1 Tax=Embleya sp. NBC_00896 TaxID=2975961 RepID=UPI0038658049|nr:hypothetical protein OG928_29950 [Embleya sp. NBC_00896]